MIVKNKKTGQEFTTNTHEWENSIVAKGLSDKYDILEDDKPIELKQLSVEILKKKENKKK